jgi:DNA-binding CsgD family transcriptional regulator
MSPGEIRAKRVGVSSAIARTGAASPMSLFVVNEACEVKSVFPEQQMPEGSARFLRDGGTRLIPEIESAIRTILAAREWRPSLGARTTVLDSGPVLHVSPLLISEESTANRYAIVIEADRSEECIVRAVNRYSLTNRQTDVLLLVLEGANAHEVARELQISEYTAQGYIKALLMKTGSRNRTAMVSKILQWPGGTPRGRSGKRTAAACVVNLG